MTQVVSSLRVMGTVLLGATELALVALFAVAVSADSSNINEMGCLLLHCVGNLLVWTNEVYVILRRGRDPKDVAYVVISTMLVIITAIAFGLFAFNLAELGSQNGKVDFATLGAPLAYAVLIMSWLVTMLAIQSLVFAGVDKYHAYFDSNSHQNQKENTTRPTGIDPTRTRTPLPLTIINVVQNGEHELYRNPNVAMAPHIMNSKSPMTPKTAVMAPKTANVRLEELEKAMQADTPPPMYKTTYNHWPGQM
ncbi:hypothetical protein BC629DRAFT_681678 [Irpex lacteus]|nr:hypothetical protein BC629DRAFT_681678 [Irpex lacteus]